MFRQLLSSLTLKNKLLSTRKFSNLSSELKQIQNYWPIFKKDCIGILQKYDSEKVAEKWFDKALEYNVPNGKKIRGLLAFKTQQILSKDWNEENIRLALIFSWCVEMAEGAILIQDDLEDQSLTRRGQPSWYSHEAVGNIAVNDALMIKNIIPLVLEKYFRSHFCYADLTSTFNEASFATSVGQSLDLQSTKKNVLEFSMDLYEQIAKNKTAYYTLNFPVMSSMHIVGLKDPTVLNRSNEILLEIGQYFQIQDDYIDCFGDPARTGKIGTDIKENKCSWLAVKCVEHATEQQKEILVENYGSSDLSKEAKVKKLYREMKLEKIYESYEAQFHENLSRKLKTSEDLPIKVFEFIMETLFKRKY